ARYVHDGNAPLSAWLAAIPIGFVASAILVANNLRDIDTDAAARKKTLAVILGSDWTRVLYGILMVSAFALVAVFAIADRMPRGAIVAVPFGLMAVRPIRRVLEGVEGRSLVAVLRSTARVHLALGLAIGVGAAIWHLGWEPETHRGPSNQRHENQDTWHLRGPRRARRRLHHQPWLHRGSVGPRQRHASRRGHPDRHRHPPNPRPRG